MSVITKKALSLILCIFTIASFFACGGGSGNTTDSTGGSDSETKGGTPTDIITLISDKASDYVIVRPENKDAETDAATELRRAVNDKYGIRLAMQDDWDGNGTTAHEIIIGHTSREETKNLICDMRADDWSIRMVGEKLVICGGSTAATVSAVRHFIDTYITGGETLSLDAKLDITNRFEYPVKLISISGKQIPSDGSDFAILYPDDASATVISYAERIGDYIFAVSGIELSVLPESKSRAKSGILIGQTKAEGDSLSAERGKLNEGGWLIANSGDYIVVSGSDSGSTVAALRGFIVNNLGISLSGKYTGDGQIMLDSVSEVNADGLTVTDPCTPGDGKADFVFDINGKKDTGKTADSLTDTVGEWSYKNTWLSGVGKNLSADYPFIKYVQLDLATGGDSTRDLFKAPLDASVKDDYNFTPLITACRNIVDAGMLPWIKTGNVPLKFSARAMKIAGSAKVGDYTVNIYPPDDYTVYYNYIKALAEALVEEFGIENVRSWRFGVLSGFNDRYLFNPDGNNGSAAFDEYCKLYDYTSEALISVLGDSIYISAQGVGYEKGLFDEADFLRHCASGKNNCTGKTGAKLSALAVTYYDDSVGKIVAGGATKLISGLRRTAESLGLKGLEFGLDSAGILYGSDGMELKGHAVGYSYQAAYDAAVLKQLTENDVDYIVGRAYTAGTITDGLKTVSYHVAKLFSQMAGEKTVESTVTGNSDRDAGVLATIGDDGKMHIMGYVWKDDVSYKGKTSLRFTITLPAGAEKVKVTRYVIDDNANFYDEWRNGFTKNTSMFWSADSARLPVSYNSAEYEFYAYAGADRGFGTASSGVLTLDVTTEGNAAVFFTVEPVK